MSKQYLTIVFEITDADAFESEKDQYFDRMLPKSENIKNPVVAAAWENSVEINQELEDDIEILKERMS